jgi:hypothetical protein
LFVGEEEEEEEEEDEVTRDKTIEAGFNSWKIFGGFVSYRRYVARSLYYEGWFIQELRTHSKATLPDFYTLQFPHFLKIFGL